MMHPIRRRWRWPALMAILALLLLAALVTPARAFEFRSGNTVTIGRDEVVNDDLFISASNVVVDGTVNGDLFVAGMDIEVNGTVNGSLFVAGQTLSVNGQVMGSFYGVGSSATLGPRAAIARNAAFAGYGLRNDEGSTVGRDLAMTGYQTVLDGQVVRNLSFTGAALVLSGRVGGDVTARVGAPGAGARIPAPVPGAPAPVAQGIQVRPDAVIGGRLVYRSEVEQSAAIQATPRGGVVFQPVQRAEERGPSAGEVFLGWLGGVLRTLVTLLILGVLAAWLVPRLLGAAVDKARTRTLAAFGWGLLLWIAGWVIVVVAAIVIVLVAILLGIVTLGGLAWVVLGIGFSALGLALTIFLFLLAYASKLVIAFLVGELIFRWRGRPYRGSWFWPLLVGVTLYALVRSIPILGPVVSAIVTLIGLGAIWLVWYERRRGEARRA